MSDIECDCAHRNNPSRAHQNGCPRRGVSGPAPVPAFERLMARAVPGDNGCLIWTGNLASGYAEIVTGSKRDGTRRNAGGHRVALEHRLGYPIPAGMVARHKCDNPPCVNPDHIELGTYADNSRDAIERGRSNFGSRNGIAKLTEATAAEARRMVANGTPQIDVARRMGVTHSCISQLIQGKTWRHVA